MQPSGHCLALWQMSHDTGMYRISCVEMTPAGHDCGENTLECLADMPDRTLTTALLYWSTSEHKYSGSGHTFPFQRCKTAGGCAHVMTCLSLLSIVRAKLEFCDVKILAEWLSCRLTPWHVSSAE